MTRCVVIFAVLVLWSGVAHAGHPLITDDTGTQGKGNLQIEMNGEFSTDRETVAGVGVEEKAFEASTTLSYGLADSLDVVVGVPYQWVEVEEGGMETADDGLADVSVELKWRFYEKDGFALAIKPGLALPTGNEEKGFGNGRISYSLFFITTLETERWAFHMNTGYIRNEYKLAEDEAAGRRDMWHLSLALEFTATDPLKLVANVGMETNQEKGEDTPPAFVLGGVIYALNDNMDLDFGIKAGLNRPETDVAFLAGIALRL